ncbi:hypothetical protein [Pseudotabrizicola algicola]|uniref:Holin n=1 Tax=Pseudotabrizicola algicola TaxID=2709381 RepID=A0A6B3RLN9_9RHOB|nr:hypothetical protein [Pseudotabrizicola algicola]NEX45175.1 hypothetical protein [Pseudotabrizicola algicola]
MTDPSPFKTLDFWIAVIVALIIKIKTTATLGPKGVAFTVLTSVGAAWVFTGYAADVFGAPEPVAAAIVTLTAEGVMRWLLMAVNDPRAAIDLWKYWRKP